jgi:hypothetical protein
MIQSILNTLFGCAHQRTTFPLTPSRKSGGFTASNHRSGAYVVCLDCGKEFSYDWKEMRVGEVMQPFPSAASARAAASIQ